MFRMSVTFFTHKHRLLWTVVAVIVVGVVIVVVDVVSVVVAAAVIKFLAHIP